MGTISGKYFPEIAFLDELGLQCQLAEQALKALNIGFAYWRKSEKTQPISFSAPLEQVRSAHSFLSHANSIGKLISLKGRKQGTIVKRRVSHLQALLELSENDIPNLSSLKLRNDWEHMDERLDIEFDRWDGGKIAIEDIRVLPKKDVLGLPQSSIDDTLVLRGIDPDTPAIYFLSQKISIPDIASEIFLVKESMKKAWPKLSAGSIPPLFPKAKR